MILHFIDPIDGEDKTYEVYQSERGMVVVAVYAGVLAEEEIESDQEIESFIALGVADWVTLLSAVNQEGKKP